MPRRAGQGRVQHTRHFGPGLQPSRHFERGLFLLRQPHAHGTQPTQGQPAIIRAGILSQPAGSREQRLPVRLGIHRDAADQDIRMPGRIFRRCLDRDVDAVLERLEVMDAPGVVHHHLRPGGMRHLGQRRHVLHLEGVTAGALRIHNRSVRPHQPGQARPVDYRVIECRLDTEPGQHTLGEGARRPVHTVRHQHVIAGFQERQQRRRHRGEAGADDRAFRAALDLGDDIFQRPMRGTAGGAVGHHPLAAHAGDPLALCHGWIEHCGAAQ